MKSTLAFVRRCLATLTRRRPPTRSSGPPHLSIDPSVIRMATEDPDAGMRKALAMAMLLG